MFEHSKNSKKRGEVGVATAILWFTAHGYNVSIPLTDSQSYDLIVDLNMELKRVQVKTTTHRSRHGTYLVALRTLGTGFRPENTRKFDSSHAELLFVTTSSGVSYLIPTEELKAHSELALGKQVARFRLVA